ncbi:MAG: ribokinase, partial [Erysipelotrichia bacterium]|nr:ribokinase [Erysipelotrichia bacterium]
CIILYPGPNAKVSQEYITHVLDEIKNPGYLLLQNEISEIPYLIHHAYQRGHQIVLNASPFDKSLLDLDLNEIVWLMINEVEGYEFSGKHSPDEIIQYFLGRYPNLGIVLTLGSAGSIVVHRSERVEHGIYHVPVIDTTAAGDTFTGYFTAVLANRGTLKEAVDCASAASALAVTKTGAAPSIPMMEEVRKLIDKSAENK